MIRMDIKRTDFYNELSQDKQHEYFETKFMRCLPGIDNIYYSVHIRHDENKNSKLSPFFRRVSKLKEQVSKEHQSQLYGHGMYVDYKTYKLHRYCLTCEDLYDVFVIDYLPNEDTPRIIVQVRSYGLWVNGWETMLEMSFECVTKIFAEYDCQIYRVRENRIDYCYHNNLIQSPERIFGDRSLSGSLKTTMQGYQVIGRVNGSNPLLTKDYFALGARKSNYVYIRFYDKALEVVSQGYKGYFFPIWRENGLISAFDEYCLSYAYKEKGGYNAIHRARLQYYVEHGTDTLTRREYELALTDKNMTCQDYKSLADGVVPQITTVFNVEFETKRKFYHLSDAFIQSLPMKPEHEKRGESMKRMYQVLDNRDMFLDFLTDTTVRFIRRNGQYCDWWQRLRDTKTDALPVDERLVRDYSNEMDHEVMKRRFINNVAVNAVYRDNVNTTFIEDISDMLSNINDNDKYNMRLAVEGVNGTDTDYYVNEYTTDYMLKKAVAEKRLRNRKKKADA